jgi:hypothetical protein
MNGPFCVIVKRSPDGWHRVVGLYQTRPGYHRTRHRSRIARSVAAHCRDRHDAIVSARVLFNQMRAN